MPRLGLLVALVTLSLIACGTPEPAARDTLVVLAAASLTKPFETIGRDFERSHPGTMVAFSFGASSALATQIVRGAPADVFASASWPTMATVTATGAANPPVSFARNNMAMAVPAGNPGGVAALADLARPGVRVALCQVEAPCGSTAQAVLTNAGLRVRPVTEEADAAATLAKVRLGEVDAAVVYASDVRSEDDRVTGIEIPAEVNASTSYPIATLARARNPNLADQFVAHVRSPAGHKVLADSGFEDA